MLVVIISNISAKFSAAAVRLFRENDARGEPISEALDLDPEDEPTTPTVSKVG